jgi:hypothetical protein
MKRTEQYGDALHAMTCFVNESILGTIRNLPNTEKSEPYKFTYTVLNKLNAGLNTCALLIKNVESSYHFADSIMVILRSLISDTVMFYHILNKSKGDDAEMASLIKSLYFDHLDYTLKDPEFISLIMRISKPEAEVELLQRKRWYLEYYNNDGSPSVASWKTTVKGAVKFALTNPVNPNVRDLMRSLFHYYDIFSKYEHFGFLTFELTHRQYREERIKEVVFQIRDSINCLTSTIECAIGLWPDIQARHRDTFLEHVRRMVSHEH